MSSGTVGDVLDWFHGSRDCQRPMESSNTQFRRSLWTRVREGLGFGSDRPDDKPLQAPTRLAWLTAGCAMPFLTALLARIPGVVEREYTNGIGHWIQRALARISALVPFSIAEIAALVLVLYVLFLASRGVIQVAQRKRHALNAAACGVLWLGRALGLAILLAYAAWAFNFARADIVTRQRWSEFAIQPGADAARKELELWCTKLVEHANREFALAAGPRDPEKSSEPAGRIAGIDASLEEAYAAVANRLDLPESFAAVRGRAKPILASFMLSATLIGGFYSPWTGEANYNPELPKCNLPQAIAHEKAHQRGIVSEDEANFFGFLACIHSRDAYVRYSGYLFAQQQLLRELRRADPYKARELAARRSQGVQQDIEESMRFVTRHRGVLSDVNATAIDAYLKANRTPGGIQAYAMSSRLIIIYTRKAGTLDAGIF
jgi:hypothetical protein